MSGCDCRLGWVALGRWEGLLGIGVMVGCGGMGEG